MYLVATVLYIIVYYISHTLYSTDSTLFLKILLVFRKFPISGLMIIFILILLVRPWPPPPLLKHLRLGLSACYIHPLTSISFAVINLSRFPFFLLFPSISFGCITAGQNTTCPLLPRHYLCLSLRCPLRRSVLTTSPSSTNTQSLGGVDEVSLLLHCSGKASKNDISIILINLRSFASQPSYNGSLI